MMRRDDVIIQAAVIIHIVKGEIELPSLLQNKTCSMDTAK